MKSIKILARTTLSHCARLVHARIETLPIITDMRAFPIIFPSARNNFLGAHAVMSSSRAPRWSPAQLSEDNAAARAWK
jgi:hypothetical protein